MEMICTGPNFFAFLMKLKKLSFCVLLNILIIELLEVQLGFNLFLNKE